VYLYIYVSFGFQVVKVQNWYFNF